MYVCNVPVKLCRTVQYNEGQQNPRNQLTFCISGLVHVDCTEALYYDHPEMQNSVVIGILQYVHTRTLCARA